jgi:adenylate cyclase
MRRSLGKKIKDARAIIALCMTITLFIGSIQFSGGYTAAMLDRMDLLLYDLRFNLLLSPNKQPSPHRIVIIDIDERSLKEIGHWPWSRRIVAELVDKLAGYGVVSATFDVVFSEPESNIAMEIAGSPVAADIAPTLQSVAKSFDYDQRFADSASKLDVILGFIFHGDNFQVNQLPESNVAASSDIVNESAVKKMQGFTTNIPVLQQAVRGEGYINGPPDMDGIVRRTPLVLRYGDKLYPSLALQTALTFLLQDEVTPVFIPNADVNNVQSIKVGEFNILTDEEGKMLIPYRGGKGSFKYISAADVIHGTADAELLASSIAVVGTSAIGLVDLRTTPVGANYPGVESQATVIDALLRGDVAYKPDFAKGLNLMVIMLLGTLIAFVMPLIGPGVMTLLGTGAFGLLVGVNFWLWHKYGLDLPMAAPLLMVTLQYVFNLSFGFLSSAQQKDQIKGMFGQYLAPAHIDRLLADPSALSFTGESKTMTVLFSDIRSFTTISENLNANELKDLLNRYFTPMTEIIFEQYGTIDKYVGDMIMAFWGAPLDDDQQQEHAVNAALVMQKRLKVLREEFVAEGYPEVHVGIGINTGLMNVGDMGSSYRRAYTVLGDAVNLGSRLESITKFYGAGCLVSETTRAGLEAKFIFREVDFIIVKGKKEPIRVYEPLAATSEATEDQLRYLKDYHIARVAYLAKRWEEAQSLFASLAAKDPESAKLCKIYIERIRHYREEVLPDDWAGVWLHTEK